MKFIGKYHRKIYIVHFLTLIGLVFLPITDFLLAFLLYLPVMHLLNIIAHDYISHGYITPKNPIIEKFCLFFYSIVMGETLLDKKNYHMMHHVHWNNLDIDPTARKLHGTSFWKYIFDLYKSPLQPVSHEVINSLPTKTEIWFDKSAEKIFYIFIALTFVLLSIDWFVIVNIYVRFFIFISCTWIEYHFHKNNDEDSKLDWPWISLIYGSGAWHIYHHKFYNNEYYGPKYWKFLNLGWYFRKLLFK